MARSNRESRRGFLRRAGVTAGALAAGVVVANAAQPRRVGLYPCFMFAGDARFRIGRFAGGKITAWKAPKIAGLIEPCRKEGAAECRDCWAAPLCSGCIGGDWIETGSTAGRPACDVIRGIAETTILEVARARIQLEKKVPRLRSGGAPPTAAE
jgi:radical SAM protein with 4Fe4S-binding SPASM domain